MTSIETIVQELVSLADQKKALHITVYKPYDSSLTDYIVVAGAQNPIHARSLLQELDKFLSEKATSFDELPLHPRTSGTPESGWMILDASSIVVHVISAVIRETYELDELFEKRAAIYHF